jgi:hypothetical protein
LISFLSLVLILLFGSGANGGPFLSGLKFFWPAEMMASAAFQLFKLSGGICS